MDVLVRQGRGIQQEGRVALGAHHLLEGVDRREGLGRPVVQLGERARASHAPERAGAGRSCGISSFMPGASQDDDDLTAFQGAAVAPWIRELQIRGAVTAP